MIVFTQNKNLNPRCTKIVIKHTELVYKHINKDISTPPSYLIDNFRINQITSSS